MNLRLPSEMLIAAYMLATLANLRADEQDSGRWQPLGKSDRLKDYACGNGRVVRVRADGQIETSNDGSIWTERPLGIRTFVRGVTYGKDLFVAVGGSYINVRGVILTSRNGERWIRRQRHNNTTLYSISYGHGVFVAVGDGGTIITSPDGANWKKVCSGIPMGLASIAFGNGRFVAGGASGTILTSTNASQWIGGCLDDSVYVGRIVFEDGVFHVRKSDWAFSTTNGSIWMRTKVETAKIP